MEIIDRFGLNTDQDKIIEDLNKTVQPGPVFSRIVKIDIIPNIYSVFEK